MSVLRASGAEFDPDAFLRGSTLEACRVFRRGEPRLPNGGAPNSLSGMNIAVSDAPWSDLVAQIADAERFLAANRDEILELSRAYGPTDLTLDFARELRIDGENVVAQFDRLPASLVRLAGELGIAFELSLYACSDG